jgi:exosortase
VRHEVIAAFRSQPRTFAWLRRFPIVLFLIQAACLWPVWRWYGARMIDGSDEPWGIAALIAAFALTWPRERHPGFDSPAGLLMWSAGLTLLYALATPVAPPLVRAVIAVAALACTWCWVAGSRAKLPVTLALLALSLPIIASMQFYLGYPLRVLTAAGASTLLSPFGYDITRVGTAMQWQGHTVLVDAACSGIRMLWSGAFLACVLAARFETRQGVHLVRVLPFVLPVVLVANVFRAAALFVLEVRPEPPSETLHALVGAVSFAAMALLIAGLDHAMRTRVPKRHQPYVTFAAGRHGRAT